MAFHVESGCLPLHLGPLPLKDHPFTDYQLLELLLSMPATETRPEVLEFPTPEGFQGPFMSLPYSATCPNRPLPDRRSRRRRRANRKPYDKPHSTPSADSPHVRVGFNVSDSGDSTPLASLFPTLVPFVSSPDRPSRGICLPLMFSDDGSALGFPSMQQYLSLCKSYLDGLSDRKRDKALITKATYLAVSAVLDNHDDGLRYDAAFRFWARKMFSFDGERLMHDGKPVATTDEIYSILVECHHKASHRGRDATTKLVHDNYSWIPKDIIARFVKDCPTCREKRSVVGTSRNLASCRSPRLPRKSPLSKQSLSSPLSNRPLENSHAVQVSFFHDEHDELASHHSDQSGGSLWGLEYHPYFLLSPAALDVTPFSGHQDLQSLPIGETSHPSSRKDSLFPDSLPSPQYPECAVNDFTASPLQRHAPINPPSDSEIHIQIPHQTIATPDFRHSTAIPSVFTTAPSFTDEGSDALTRFNSLFPHSSVFSSSPPASPSCTYNGPSQGPSLDLQFSNFISPQYRTALSACTTPDLRTPSPVSSYAASNSNYSSSAEHSPLLHDWPFNTTHGETLEEYESNILDALQDLAIFDASCNVDAPEFLFLNPNANDAADFCSVAPLSPLFEQSSG